MNAQALGPAIAGGAMTAALIEVLFDKGVLTLDESRDVLKNAMRKIGIQVQSAEGAFAAHQLLGSMLTGKFSARK